MIKFNWLLYLSAFFLIANNSYAEQPNNVQWDMYDNHPVYWGAGKVYEINYDKGTRGATTEGKAKVYTSTGKNNCTAAVFVVFLKPIEVKESIIKFSFLSKAKQPVDNISLVVFTDKGDRSWPVSILPDQGKWNDFCVKITDIDPSLKKAKIRRIQIAQSLIPGGEVHANTEPHTLKIRGMRLVKDKNRTNVAVKKFDYSVDSARLANHYDWIKNDGVRGAYVQSWGTFDNIKHLANLKATGFNLVMPTCGLLQPPYAAVEHWAKLCKDAGLRLMPIIKTNEVSGLNEIKVKLGEKWQPMIAATGEKTQLPCPGCEAYWQMYLENLVNFAKAHKDVEGLVFDIEFYGSAKSAYNRANLCFCDKCMMNFFKQEKIGIDISSIPAQKRWNFLSSKKKLFAYEEMQKQVVKEFFSKVRRAVRKENPKLIFAIAFNLPHTFYDTGLCQGLGTPEQPLLMMTELTYRLDSSERGLDITRDIESNCDVYGICVPGIWLNLYQPDTLKKLCKDYITKGKRGYWIWTTSMLTPAAQKVKGPPMSYAVPDGTTIQQYWEAFRKGNQAKPAKGKRRK